MFPLSRPPSPPGHRASVLVVDDDRAVRRAMVRVLARALPEVELREAETADQAMAMLRERPVDLVVSDYRMPGMNGVDFLHALDGLSRDVPRILITAYPDVDLVVAACNDARVDRFLMKPWRKEELVGTVRDLLEQRRAREAERTTLARDLDALRKGLVQG